MNALQDYSQLKVRLLSEKGRWDELRKDNKKEMRLHDRHNLRIIVGTVPKEPYPAGTSWGSSTRTRIPTYCPNKNEHYCGFESAEQGVVVNGHVGGWSKEYVELRARCDWGCPCHFRFVRWNSSPPNLAFTGGFRVRTKEEREMGSTSFAIDPDQYGRHLRSYEFSKLSDFLESFLSDEKLLEMEFVTIIFQCMIKYGHVNELALGECVLKELERKTRRLQSNGDSILRTFQQIDEIETTYNL